MPKVRPTLNQADVNLLSQSFFTKKDFTSVNELIRNSIEEVIDERGLLTKDDIKHLPTKEEFSTKMDEVVSELKAIREEHPLMKHQISRNTRRIEKIETHLKLS
jgi:hypothetical protein